jgi:menaquinone-dependent protoporphyrinogen oxidase
MRPRRILVTAGSAHGATSEISAWIGDTLRGYGFDTEVCEPRTVTSVRRFDAVVLGGALYAGRWHKDARQFARRHGRDLRTRPVWLFSSGPLDHTAEATDIPPVRGVARIMHRLGARGHATFGGSIAGNHGFMARSMAQKMDEADFRDLAQVRAWAGAIAHDLATDPLPAMSG